MRSSFRYAREASILGLDAEGPTRETRIGPSAV